MDDRTTPRRSTATTRLALLAALLSAAAGCADGGAPAPDAHDGDARLEVDDVAVPDVEPDDGDADPGGEDVSGDTLVEAETAPDGEASTDALDAADDGDAGPPPDDLVRLTATAGWQIYPGGGYRYGPSIVIDESSTIHVWTCSPGGGGAWDYIRYRSSTDGGHTWTAETVALQPSPGTRDALAACDPGVVRLGGWWYLAYTSTEDARGTDNDLYVARSATPGGPYEKWNGTGWGGAPQPIVVYEGDPAQYGIGEPSLVLADRLYVYYTNLDGSGHTDVATVDPPVGDDWPLHLTFHGPAVVRRPWAEDSTDIKFIDALGRFVGLATIERFGPNSGVAVYQSFDGLTFESAVWQGARVQYGAHNIGLSGTPEGHLDPAAANFAAYSYNPPTSSWGDWPTFLDPVAVDTVPRGTVVFGRVSSIVGGDPGDWYWSGPKAWDGDAGTVWSSVSHSATAVAEEWVWVDLGTPRELTGATLVPRPGGYGFPVDFALQTSDDAASWTDVPGESHVGFANPGGTPVVRTFAAPVRARCLRLRATRLGADDFGNHYLQLAELIPSAS
ncbi:MAG: discoidin domain-containing protein [Deltaproteobacteria bacterium]|nr:discoidin domain-containing protein [Deltaproteobacteria bacterium]